MAVLLSQEESEVFCPGAIMKKFILYFLFLVLSFSVGDKSIYYISRAASSIEEKEKSDENKSNSDSDTNVEREVESKSDSSTNVEGEVESKFDSSTAVDENSTDESDANETDAGEEDDESDEERNERLASKSQYLTNRGTYMEVTLDVEDGNNITTQLQAAFVLAGMKATKNVPYKIIIPEGTYYLSSTLHIYSNTSLIMKNVVLVRDFQEGPMLMSGNYMEDSPYIEQENNIVIQGGTFDGNCADELYKAVTKPFSNLYFAYAKNIQIIGVKVSNNLAGHYISMKGVDNIIIRDCIFDKYYTNYTAQDSDRKEALNFGTLEVSSGIGEEKKELSCNHILIQNNKFVDVFQGIGFDYIPDSRVYQNVSIHNNTFFSCRKETLILSSLSQSSIYKNEVKNGKMRIWFESMDPGKEAKKWNCKIWENTKKKQGLDIKIYPIIVRSYPL